MMWEEMGKAQLDSGEEEASWAVERAWERVEEGDLEGALQLLERAERLHPSTRGLPEIQAVAQVCHAASWTPCACSASASAFASASPHWYRILKVNQNADLSAIKKRYRQLALLLHPDKNKHARAEEAFKLVSEAYAHLSDSNKRATFDADICKQQLCKECSSGLQSRVESRDSTSCVRESLKGKSQTLFQRNCFMSDFHTAEWKMEHAKLRMFRERAQAKVDSLAYILKERRSRWNEEMGVTRGRNKKASMCSLNKRDFNSHLYDQNQQCVGKKTFTSSLEELHSYGGTRDGVLKELGSSSSKIDVGRFEFLDSKGGLSSAGKILLEGLESRNIRGRKTPQTLQSLDGLLGLLKEQIGGSNGNAKGEAARARYGDKVVTRDHDISNATHQRNARSPTSKPQYRNEYDDELTVIDDFLAGLSEKQHLPGSCSEGAKGASLSRETSLNRTEPTTALYDNISPWHIRAASAMRSDMWVSNAVRKPSGMEASCENGDEVKENILKSQKKKWEELLGTLERLQQETKSVAATLESMKKKKKKKEHDAHHSNIFAAPRPAATIIAT